VTIVIRVAVQSDISGMHRVRLAVRENRLAPGAITESDYLTAMQDTGRGWVAEENGVVLGFAVGNKTTGNIWALFVDPDQEGNGLGSRLHGAMVNWLFHQGLPRLWLSTEPGTRAQRFYEASGWVFVRMLPHGEALYELPAPGAARCSSRPQASKARDV
jgi:GNAT superfamily N-acetyltransferase